MAEKRHAPDVIDSCARDLEWRADVLDSLDGLLPSSLDASVLGLAIAEQVEAVAADLAGLVTGLDRLASDARTAAGRYRGTEEHHVDLLSRLLPGLENTDGPPTLGR